MLVVGWGSPRAFAPVRSYDRGVTDGVPAGGDEEAIEFLREQQDSLDLGNSFGVGYTGDDIDDISPPEMHLGEVPVGFEVDSLVPHFGSGLDGGLDPEPAPLFEFEDCSTPVTIPAATRTRTSTTGTATTATSATSATCCTSDF